MSATRDKNQRFTFLYKNLYQIYKDQPPQAPANSVHAPVVVKSQIIKANQVAPEHTPTVKSYEPVELIGKRVQVSATALQPNPTVQSLKDNLKSLNELHKRLQFMLKELEDLVKS